MQKKGLPMTFIPYPGHPTPLGISKAGSGINFAIYASDAKSIKLCLFSPETSALVAEFSLHRTGKIWHIKVDNLPNNLWYGYQVDSLPNILLDPYAHAVSTSNVWGKDPDYHPLGLLTLDDTFDWEDDLPLKIPMQDLIIYEMHVRGFTKDQSSKATHKGTYLGLIEMIPHLLELGINALELLPMQEFNERETRLINPTTNERLFNYWGYATVNFFAPMNRYAFNPLPGSSINEFKAMVKALHAHGIEVILDVVFNHTGEGDEKGEILSFKGFGNSTYYILSDQNEYFNFSGTGNTFNCNHPIVREFILDALRYWVTEMHMDGFRFDLASIFNRDRQGKPMDFSPFVEAISEDPVLADTKLIAEAWDAAGLYQVGGFYPHNSRWSEWNGRYRDCMRRFIKGALWQKGEFATRLSGSNDLYWNRSGPPVSINFVVAHDGFTLADLVSYNHKHNLENGENNRDGTNQNDSWNCGAEGVASSLKVIELRNRQMRNFHVALMVSQGVPMILMGDEYAHTKKGNNNTWCQDNELNWFLWDELERNKDFFRFYKFLIHFRKEHAILRRSGFLKEKDIEWHGVNPSKPMWNEGQPFLAFTLKDPFNSHDIYVAFNATHHHLTVTLPKPTGEKQWCWVVNTENSAPHDVFEESVRVKIEEITMCAHSSIILISK